MLGKIAIPANYLDLHVHLNRFVLFSPSLLYIQSHIMEQSDLYNILKLKAEQIQLLTKYPKPYSKELIFLLKNLYLFCI